MIPVTRPITGSGRHTYGMSRYHEGHGMIRPGTGGSLRISAPLPVEIPGTGMPYAGMDPSNPLTYVRPWNPQPGMISQLNYDGAQAQSRQPTGGLQRGLQQRTSHRQFR
jgi:hypothetical protein